MGRPKGLLPSPRGAGSILETLVAAGRDAGFDVVFVGQSEPYAAIAPDVPRLDDDPPSYGPLAGLRAAQRHAVRQSSGAVVLVGCDMPYVGVDALKALRAHPSEAPIVAPRASADGPWEPMLGRYDPIALGPVLDAAIADGVRSFQALFQRLPVETLPLTPNLERALRDWDTPEDVDA